MGNSIVAEEPRQDRGRSVASSRLARDARVLLCNVPSPDVATSTWILNNNRSAPRLPDHCTPISVDYASFPQLLLLSPPAPPHNVAPPPMNLLGILKFY
ncbi:hypothetical protein IGI04_013682 [Brassica rapa subsp. trilocularis]|uniref:Ig-like domain-containing protein n=1 Tax=Brassica rapa subsp. trilocularis TaxID=1813537 RepID=A0ABQ7NA72_BRACM|nr:hypothetical protein IGI04_013682 [Brassica rapa subsp. trilocularis]